MQQIPVDFEQRKQALDLSSSFICEAPAGSGKTELLTQRVLSLLSIVAQPEAILAITFTRKAAAEMRERVFHALHRGGESEPEETHARTTWRLAQAALQRDRKLGWGLLENPNRLQVRTFDSLCAFLTQTLPLKASLGLNIGPSSDPDELYQLAVREFIQSVEEGVPWADCLAAVLAHLDNRQARLEGLLVSMLKARDGWLPVIQQSRAQHNLRDVLQHSLQEVVEERISQLHRLFNEALSSMEIKRLLELLAFAGANLRRENSHSALSILMDLETQDHLPGADSEGVIQWRAARQILLTQSGSMRTAFDKRCGFPPGATKEEKAAFKEMKGSIKNLVARLNDVTGLHAALLNIDHWPNLQYTEEQWPILESLLQLLPVLLAHLHVVFARSQEVDFIEMSERAREALGDEGAPSELALRLDQRIEHILVDEFQDTSFGQTELLARLTAGWQPDDGRTLFCVGDAMQSIYGFRGAKVGLFLHCKQFGLAGLTLQPLQLRSNFRSQGALVRWLNAAFAHAFPAQSDIAAGAVAFSAAHDFRSDLQGLPVEAHLKTEDTDAAVEEATILQIIDKTWAQNPQATIAILVRSRGHAATAVKACQKANLRFRAVELIPLAQRQAVQDVMALCKALLDPLDRVAWFSLLRAPWCGLQLGDLLCLSPENGFATSQPVIDVMRSIVQGTPRSNSHFSISDDGLQRLRRVTHVLSSALDNRERLPLRQWIEGVWVALGGPACLAEAVDIENIQSVWQMLQQLASQGELPSNSRLEEALSHLYSAADPQADERLQIMTIHKSKGLEFDVVILPELHSRARNNDTDLLCWSERVSAAGQEQWILAPIHATGDEKDPIYRFVQQEKKQRERYEACRLLYVACTRAKRHLHLLGRIRVDDETGDWLSPSEGSLLAYLWPSIRAIAQMLPDKIDGISSEDRDRQRINMLRRLPADWTGPKIAEGHLLDAFIAPFEYDNQNVMEKIFSERVDTARIVGTFVHEIMQLMTLDLNAWRQKEIGIMLPSWRQRLLAMGMTETEISDNLPAVARCVESALTHPRFVELVEAAHKVYCEHDLTVNDQDSVKRMVVDLLCDMGNDSAVIVDYKTSQPHTGQSLVEFIQHEQAVYIDILNQYRGAVRRLGYKSVKVILFFVMIGSWSEVPQGLQ